MEPFNLYVCAPADFNSVMPVPCLEDPAVETAEEAKEPPEADINELCKDMFSKMSTYLTGELTGKVLAILTCK